jgi:hypothetical protein
MVSNIEREVIHEQIRSLSRHLAELNNNIVLQSNTYFHPVLQKRIYDSEKEIENTETLLNEMKKIHYWYGDDNWLHHVGNPS